MNTTIDFLFKPKVNRLPVIGFSLTSVSGERKNVGKLETLNVNSTPQIISVNEGQIPFMENQPSLVIGFEFNTVYQPDIGNVGMKGEVVYSSKDSKKILKEWNKEKKLPIETDAEIKNYLFRKCLTFSLNLTEQLQLPAPIGFPVVVPQKESQEQDKKTSYIG